jgi:hypothetical protein
MLSAPRASLMALGEEIFPECFFFADSFWVALGEKKFFTERK